MKFEMYFIRYKQIIDSEKQSLLFKKPFDYRFLTK